jgi:hypothetical protein
MKRITIGLLNGCGVIPLDQGVIVESKLIMISYMLDVLYLLLLVIAVYGCTVKSVNAIGVPLLVRVMLLITLMVIASIVAEGILDGPPYHRTVGTSME